MHRERIDRKRSQSANNSSLPMSSCNISYICDINELYNDTARQEIAVGDSDKDVIEQVVGDFGIWQLRTILIIFLCKIPAAWFMACIIFTAPELYPNAEYQCDALEYTSNCTVTADQCYIVENFGSDQYALRECRRFLYNYSFHSLIMQFDLVCLCDIFVAWSQYWHLFGMLVGGVAATKLMRWVSPRNLYVSGILSQIVCGIVTGYVHDFSLHCAFRCLAAVCCSLMVTAGQAIFTDITAGKQRIGAVILYDTFWSVALILLPGIAAFAQSWRHIYIGISLPSLVLLFLLLWTPESPRWLLKHANDEQSLVLVEQIVRDAARLNERESYVPRDLTQQLSKLRRTLKATPASARWLQLWQGPRAKTHMIAVHMALALYLINFMGLLLNIRSFGRDYLAPNTIAIGCAEIVGCFLALYLTFNYSKWKWQWAGGFSIIAGLIGCLCWFFTNVEMAEILEIMLWMTFAAVPKAAVSCSQCMIQACMHEFMPPHKRATFGFSVVTWARLWLLSASFLTVLKQINIALSLSSFCVLVIIGGICTCFLLTPRPAERHVQNVVGSVNNVHL